MEGRMTYVVLGASGNTGRLVAEQLLAQGKPVRVVGRSAERLAAFTAQGATAAIGDQGDAAFLAQALHGATAVYAMFPPHYQAADWRAYIRSLTHALVTALEANGAPRTVLLSSIGAQHAAGLGPISLMHDVEAALRGVTSLDLLVLRPGYFFENLYGALPTIRDHGINGGIIAPDLPLSMIATKDIAAAAVQGLLHAGRHDGRIHDLLGPREYTLREATTLIGRAIGKPELPYVVMTGEQMQGALVGSGFSSDVAAKYIEMMDGFNRGLATPDAPRSAASTTPTTLESFIPQLVQGFLAAR
jgi:uncharacterized protein YbjT (DUF2867 family)